MKDLWREPALQWILKPIYCWEYHFANPHCLRILCIQAAFASFASAFVSSIASSSTSFSAFSFSALSTMACKVPSWLHSCATNLRGPISQAQWILEFTWVSPVTISQLISLNYIQIEKLSQLPNIAKLIKKDQACQTSNTLPLTHHFADGIVSFLCTAHSWVVLALQNVSRLPPSGPWESKRDSTPSETSAWYHVHRLPELPLSWHQSQSLGIGWCLSVSYLGVSWILMDSLCQCDVSKMFTKQHESVGFNIFSVFIRFPSLGFTPPEHFHQGVLHIATKTRATEELLQVFSDPQDLLGQCLGHQHLQHAQSQQRLGSDHGSSMSNSN